jgi:CheY-like chemotaxis protein
MEEKNLGKEIELQKNLSQSREKANLGDFIPGLVYKLNSHLAPMVGYAQLLLPKIVESESKWYLEKIIEEAQQASQILKDFVDFLRKRELRKEVVDLNGLIEHVIEMKVAELTFKNITVVKELSPFIPLTQVDPKQIQQVMLNLISNAEEAISEFHGFGEIKVKTRVVNGSIEITVSDDGPGIASENISKIFAPFFTTKEKRIGLGLSISYDTVTKHGGTMRAISEWGKGATFIIALPIIEVKGEKRKERGEIIERDLKGTKGLVIDDDPNILDVLYRYLMREGCEVVGALDVETALNIIEVLDFDFVICDIRMPGMGGIEFYKAIEEKKPFLKNKIIFSTGDIMGDTTRAFFELVTNPQVGKPFNFDELKEVIKSIL